jgi:predicted nuclease of restriction endonuclease-like (RecB) superfamily
MEYKDWFYELKSKIKQSQIKASVAVNSQLTLLYWELGREIVDKQENAKWGSGFINQLSKDLKTEFPEMSGFSRANLFAIKKFYSFHYQQNIIVHQLGGQSILDNIPENRIVHQVGGQIDSSLDSSSKSEIVQQLAGQLEMPKIIQLCCQIPWRHNVVITEKIKNQHQAQFYIQQTIENNWSRAVLEMQIESDLYGRQGKAINNFKNTLPEIESDLAIAILKDPYNFGFLTMGSKIKEVELEQKLIENITHFLLELGKGFAYMGRQFTINVGGKEYRTDLLFYHTKLKCYIIIELKVKEFEPEHIGKLNFYLSAINELVKDETDKPTIGILLCKSKNNIVVDFALKDINKPLGISEFTYTELSNEIKQALPTIEQLTAQLIDEEIETN